jgi:DNA-binding response OmpR family regulator
MNSAHDPLHVLVVDDNVDAAEVLAMLIETEGLSAATALSLAQGREQIARQRPRMVFLDLNLPDGNGLSLLAELKADQHTAVIDVVMLSGTMDARVMEESHLLGASAFVVKPMGHEQLSAFLDKVR